MKFSTKKNKKTSTPTKEFALKNYKTYVTHYESRKLKPMPFAEFLKNYCS